MKINSTKNQKIWFLCLIISSLILESCTFSVESKSTAKPDELASEAEFDESNNDKSPSSFILEEAVTTNDGIVVKAKIGEMVDRQELSNGVVIDGVIYE